MQKGKHEFPALPLPLAAADANNGSASERVFVIAGLNGTGKSRLLSKLNATPGSNLLICVHELCEYTRTSLRSRVQNLEGFTEDEGAEAIPKEVIDGISAIVGRQYEEVRWYSLDFDPGTEGGGPVGFHLAEDVEPVEKVPYFTVKYGGHNYDSLGMGLGELSVHLLFWYLNQLRLCKGLTLFLDEVDAYLAPSTRERLLGSLLRLAHQNTWRVVMTTHSQEIMTAALSHHCLYVAEPDDQADARVHFIDYAGSSQIEALLPTSTSIWAFVEDESAKVLLAEILRRLRPALVPQVLIIFGGGTGRLRALAKAMPKSPVLPVKLVYVFDGDAEEEALKANNDTAGWSALTLPTDFDPDTLMRTAADDVPALAKALHHDETHVRSCLLRYAGEDAHDWVNNVSDRLGNRLAVMGAFCGIWLDTNSLETEDFCVRLEDILVAAE